MSTRILTDLSSSSQRTSSTAPSSSDIKSTITSSIRSPKRQAMYLRTTENDETSSDQNMSDINNTLSVKIQRCDSTPTPNYHQRIQSSTPSQLLITSQSTPSRTNITNAIIRSSTTPIQKLHVAAALSPIPSLIPPPIPSPEAFLLQDETNSHHTNSTPSFATPVQKKKSTPLHIHSSPPCKSSQWLSALSAASTSTPRSARKAVAQSPSSGSSSNHHRVGTPQSDRFIPTRRALIGAIALEQSSVNEIAYSGFDNVMDATMATTKENPSSPTPVGSPLEQLDAQESLLRFRQRLACSLMELPPSLNLESPSSASSGTSHRTTSITPRVLFPTNNTSPTNASLVSSSSSSSLLTSHHHDHQAQLVHTFRSGETAATPKRSLLEGGLNGIGSSVSHSRHKRTFTFGQAPSPARALAERQAFVSPEAARVLDCPNLVNDYYLNLIHWNVRGVLAIALGTEIYLWNQATCAVESLDTTCPNDNGGNEVTSVRWSHDGSTLSVGYRSGRMSLFDGVTKQLLHTFDNLHTARVSTMDWSPENGTPSILATGGLDTNIRLIDTRLNMEQGRHHHNNNNIVATYSSHREEVCGLAFSQDGFKLASGANDNKLCIWSLKASNSSNYGNMNGIVGARNLRHLELTHHKAAVKALAWCPWQEHTLASGGGLADGHIRFANTITGEEIQSIDTKSQVCSLQWSRTERELISAHGHPDHTLVVWKFPELTKVATLRGHTSRVLHTGLSPDGSTVVSAGADETLRFWKVWKSIPAVKKETKAENWIRSSPMHKQIR